MPLSDAGRQAHPEVEIDEEEFAAYVRERDAAGAKHLDDLYLACGCLRRLPAALAAFDRLLVARVGEFVCTVDRSPAFVGEVQQRLRERLFVGDPPRIAIYDGSSPLGAWVRVVSLRLALDLVAPKKETPSRDGELDALALDSDPHSDLLRMKYLDAFQEALSEAVQSLPKKERNLLRLYYVERLGIDELAPMYKAHRATCARWLVAARELLLESIKKRIRERHGVSDSEFDSLAGMMVSGLHISLSRLEKTQ
jgi:RNA polymerase sigma-70 factor (ECF subfamily)